MNSIVQMGCRGIPVSLALLLSIAAQSRYVYGAVWVGPVSGAGWFDSPTNWDGGLFPGPADGGTIRGGASVSYDASGQPGGSSSINDLRVGMDVGLGSGELRMTAGTLLLNRFSDEAARMGQNGQTGGVIQTGGTIQAVNGGFRIGDGLNEAENGESGYYTISGGSMIASGLGDLGRIVVGDHDGNAIMTVVGSGPTLISSSARLEVESNATLNFTLDANGVTPIVSTTLLNGDQPRFRPADADGPGGNADPGGMLAVDFTALTTVIGDILLIDNRSTDGAWVAADQAVNAPEGAVLKTFGDGSFYTLTYAYTAGGDGRANDMALIATAIPEAASWVTASIAVLGFRSVRRAKRPTPIR